MSSESVIPERPVQPDNAPDAIALLHRLAKQKRTHRLEVFLTTFADTAAKPWAFTLSPAFMDALDIRLTMKRQNKIGEMRWTQGSRFEFREGSMIYQTISNDGQATDKQSKPKIAYQVLKSSPAIPATNDKYTWENRPEKNVIKNTIEKYGQNHVSHEEKIEKNGTFILRVQTKRFAGYLEVSQYNIDTKTNKFTLVETFPISQDHFIELLITGIDPTKVMH